jgi:hypothetical protein
MGDDAAVGGIAQSDLIELSCRSVSVVGIGRGARTVGDAVIGVERVLRGVPGEAYGGTAPWPLRIRGFARAPLFSSRAPLGHFDHRRRTGVRRDANFKATRVGARPFVANY